MVDEHFTSSVELARVKRRQAVAIAMSSITEALISEVFKRPVLWGHRIKNYHNRDFVDKEWRNLSQTLNISSKYYYIAFCIWFIHKFMYRCAELSSCDYIV